METDNNYIDSDDDASYTYKTPYSLIYILSLLFLVYMGIFIYHYLLKKKKIKIINNAIKKRGEIKEYDSDSIISPEICTICYSNYTEKDKLFTFGCSHSYHYTCIYQLFEKLGNDSHCPYCKQTVSVLLSTV